LLLDKGNKLEQQVGIVKVKVLAVRVLPIVIMEYQIQITVNLQILREITQYRPRDHKMGISHNKSKKLKCGKQDMHRSTKCKSTKMTYFCSSKPTLQVKRTYTKCT
jgi:hypothetical protein